MGIQLSKLESTENSALAAKGMQSILNFASRVKQTEDTEKREEEQARNGLPGEEQDTENQTINGTENRQAKSDATVASLRALDTKMFVLLIRRNVTSLFGVTLFCAGVIWCGLSGAVFHFRKRRGLPPLPSLDHLNLSFSSPPIAQKTPVRETKGSAPKETLNISSSQVNVLPPTLSSFSEAGCAASFK